MAKLEKAIVKSFEIDGISGLKTIVGVFLIVTAHALGATKELIVLLPDVSVLVQIEGYLISAVVALQKALTIIGGGFTGVGILDKIIKFVKSIFGSSK